MRAWGTTEIIGTIITVLFFVFVLAFSAFAHEAEHLRGGRCSIYGHEQECWDKEKVRWEMAIAHAQGAYANGISNLLADYVRLGRPGKDDTSTDTWVYKRYLRLHKAYLNRCNTAGIRWLYETQGYDHERSRAICEFIVFQTEGPIDSAQISSWLWAEVF